MPLSPAHVAQRGHPNILPVLEPVVRMLLRIIQRSCSLEVLQSFGEFTGRHTRCAHDPMGNAQRGRVVIPFGLFEELYGRLSLIDDFASNVEACPYPVKYSKFL